MAEKPQGVIDLLNIIFEIERNPESLQECREAIQKNWGAARERFMADEEKLRTMKWVLDEYAEFYGWKKPKTVSGRID